MTGGVEGHSEGIGSSLSVSPSEKIVLEVEVVLSEVVEPEPRPGLRLVSTRPARIDQPAGKRLYDFSG